MKQLACLCSSRILVLAATISGVLQMAPSVASRFGALLLKGRQRLVRPTAFVQQAKSRHRSLQFEPIVHSLPRTGHLSSRPLLSTEQSLPAGFRLYHSSPLQNRGNRKKDDDDDDTIFDKATKLAKNFLPSTWFQSDEEKKAEQERKRVQKAVKSEIKQLFKDAPLGLRMLGGMIGPILGGLASNLAETAATQQELVDVVYRRAVANIMNDGAVVDALGNGIDVGRPFSQSSSSSSINGATTMRVELAFEVSGSRRRGVGRVVSTGKGSDDVTLQLLEVQVDGRVIPVSTSRVSSSSKRATYLSSNDDSVIEAEIIEKDTKSK
jgi:Cytochrome oxidase complex assembly protein 1